MFLDKKLENIRKAKDNLATCSELRRQLVQIEVSGIRRRARRAFSDLSLGLNVAQRIFGFLSNRNSNSK